MLKQGFTLVELLVIMTIGTILSTIGFFAYQNNALESRNTVRLQNVSMITRSIDIFRVEKSRYPSSPNMRSVTHSGVTIWNEGVFGSGVTIAMGSAMNTVLDPLVNVPFTYSVTPNNSEYQLGYAIESNILSASFFGGSPLIAQISGKYNGQVLQAKSGGNLFVLAAPSIISSDGGVNEYSSLVNQKKIVFSGYSNLPSSYQGAISSGTGQGVFQFGPTSDILLYDSKTENLINNQEDRLQFYKNLSEIYNQSILAKKPEYLKYSQVYADIYNPTLAFINISCETVNNLLSIPCAYGDQVGELRMVSDDFDSGSGSTGTGTNPILAKLPSGKTNYAGQWTIGQSWGQGLQTPNKERNSLSMTGGLARSIGVKWKYFTRPQAPSLFLGGYDIDGDGTENLLYGYGGKIFLGDIVTRGNIWETKVLDIQAILGIEAIKSDGSKSIIVAFGPDWYLGVISGKTGELEWVSEYASGAAKKLKAGWAILDYKVFDINNDGVKEYHFKQWYDKYHSFHFFESGGKVVGETLWSTLGYGDYNQGSDGYQVREWSMGTINNKLVVGTKGSNNFAFYSNDVNSAGSGISKYQMPGFGKLLVGGNTGAGWSSSSHYFYDIDNDGNDEYIYRITEETNNNKMGRIGVAGLSSTGTMTQYFSVSNPKILVSPSGLG